MNIADPLRIKVADLLRSTSGPVLDLARLRYGSPSDLDALATDWEQSLVQGELLVADFTPFVRTVKPEFVDDLSSVLARHRNPVLLLSETAFAESLLGRGLPESVSVVRYDASGALVAAQPCSPADVAVDMLLRRIRDRRTLQALHRSAAESRLRRLLSERTVRTGTSLPSGPEWPTRVVGGRKYIVMPNRMLVSSFIDSKRIFATETGMLTVAMEVIRDVRNSFCEPTRDCEVVVASSNAALHVASTIAAITGMDLCAVDKMGPLPTRHLTALHSSTDVAGRSVALIAEVSATGGEIDRTVQFLALKKAKIERVVCCYNLDVGRPLLADEGVLASLCTPKTDLGYVYRSA